MQIKAGIIGGAGYTGGELLRILVHHPSVTIAFAHSSSNGGNLISSVHTDLLGDTDLLFATTAEMESQLSSIDVLFLCAGHGEGKKFLSSHALADHTKVIDLSHDFRLKESATQAGRSFIYGLPELYREEIKLAQNIANPGCFATCIQLGLLPLFKQKLATADVHIQATTGSTGAGQGLSPTTHFSWRNNNLSVYKAFEHQHLGEIGENLAAASVSELPKLNFVPLRGDFTRGILASMYTETDLSLEEAYQLYEDYYKDQPFTHVSRTAIDLKQVVNTNKCLIYLEKHDNQLLVISIIDNLLKGASGQAVQNMNLMFGLEEKEGLRLKGVGF